MYKNKIISCVVLNYNDAAQTIEFVQSMLNSHFIDSFVIVDNCSTDDSYNQLIMLQTDRVIVKKTEKNGGYGYGNNFGVNVAKNVTNADYVIISNPDVKFDDETVGKTVDVFFQKSNAAVVSAIQINGYTNKEIFNYAWNIPSYYDYLYCSLLLLNRLTRKRISVDKSMPAKSVGCVPGAFLVVDVEKFISLGGYDERVFLFCEESMLGYKIQQKGYKTYLLTNNYYYHFHSTSIKKSIPKEISRHKMVLRSREFYINNYLKVSCFKKKLAKFVFSLSMLEYRLLYMLR